eukprot:548545_1
MSATDDASAAVKGPNETFESLTLTLQQIAASAQTNSENFETQKKQFMQQFSQLFGSLNTTLKPKKESNTNNNTLVSPSNDRQSTTPMLSLPSLKKQLQNSSSNNCSKPFESIPIANGVASIPNMLPLNPLNFTPQTMPNMGGLSVPMSLISNGSHQSTMYPYPYIASTPNPATTAAAAAALMNTRIKSPIINTQTSPNPTTTAYESYWMRRILSNILLLFFRYHPNGVLECELSQFYSQMFNEELMVTTDLKYLLCVHKSILITNTKERGQLYTLNDDQISLFLQEFEIGILEPWIVKHIRRLFRCFPNGIACHCLEDLLFNMVQFRLSTIMPSWHEFVCNIASMYCTNLNGIDTFIVVDFDDFNKKYAAAQPAKVTQICANNIEYYLSSHLNSANILRRPVGYCELLIVLLSSYYTTDMNNAYFAGIDGETLEKAFHSSYQSRLVHEAPFIQDVLGKICQITIVKDTNKLYKLLSSSKQYFDTQPDAFAPILKRSLELIVSVEKKEEEEPKEETLLPQSPFKEDHVSVFMGGFGQGTTVDDLRIELAKKGITMISCSGISYRNYGWSFVTLSNDKEAQYLISVSPIQIGGRMIDVRPFINRQRVRNHIANKPSNLAMLRAMIDLFEDANDGLTVAEIQSKLFRKFSYRIDGPELTKIVGDNPKHLHIKRHQTERIYWTPKLAGNVSLDEVMIKINKLWKHIKCNYYGNVYNEEILPADGISDHSHSAASNKSGDNEYTISESDFENEFARRYRYAIDASNFGFTSVKLLLESLPVPFRVIVYEYPVPQHTSYSAVKHIKPYMTISTGYNYHQQSNNVTSPRYITSNHSSFSRSMPAQIASASVSPLTPYNSTANTLLSPPASQSNVQLLFPSVPNSLNLFKMSNNNNNNSNK